MSYVFFEDHTYIQIKAIWKRHKSFTYKNLKKKKDTNSCSIELVYYKSELVVGVKVNWVDSYVDTNLAH